jgi:hypothetical protein
MFIISSKKQLLQEVKEKIRIVSWLIFAVATFPVPFFLAPGL